MREIYRWSFGVCSSARVLTLAKPVGIASSYMCPSCALIFFYFSHGLVEIYRWSFGVCSSARVLTLAKPVGIASSNMCPSLHWFLSGLVCHRTVHFLCAVFLSGLVCHHTVIARESIAFCQDWSVIVLNVCDRFWYQYENRFLPSRKLSWCLLIKHSLGGSVPVGPQETH